MLKQFLENIIKPIVDQPDKVRITEIEGEAVCIYDIILVIPGKIKGLIYF